jgi:hypothetical protein
MAVCIAVNHSKSAITYAFLEVTSVLDGRTPASYSEGHGSNLSSETGYHDWYSSWLSSVSPGKFRDSISN